MPTKLQIGLLLPHFGKGAAYERVLDSSKKAEAYGFDSVWVRDHLVFQPHGHEGTDNTFYEAFITLGAIAAITKRLILGTGVIIPHRHPIHLAQSCATLSRLSRGRVILGIGAGTFPHEFEASERPHINEERFALVKENVEIIRKLWTGAKVAYQGRFFSFKDVGLNPTPVRPIPVWYGGGTPASCRRAVEYCDGWMPGRLPLASFKARAEYMRDLCKKAGREMVSTGAIPVISIDRDKERAASWVNIKGLLDNANKRPTWVKPPSGKFSKLEDLEGLILAGTPEDIVRDTRKYEDAGLNHIVYDLRFRQSDWDGQLDILGTEVLPMLRR
jgi:probable F420-dependent oxidoreductase